MQNTFINSPPWLQTALTILASLITGGGIVRFYNSWLNRRKPAAEIHVTEATAAEIHVRAGMSASDAVMRMMGRLDAAQVTIDRLRSERDNWELQAFDLQVELKEARAENAQLLVQARLDNLHMRKQAAFIESKNLKEAYLALDKPESPKE